MSADVSGAAPDAAGAATPTPRTFYVHDDLTDDVAERYGAGSAVLALARALLERLRREGPRVIVLTVGEQVDAVLARGPHRPFELTVAIGGAGERVARQLHARSGWFPVVRRVGVTRVEDGRGGYELASTTAEPLDGQLGGLDGCASLALVDDTVFSGLTLRTILERLPAPARARAHAFCLRGVAETLPSIARLCPITVGMAAPGRILEDVSFINASGLVRRVGIRRAGRPPLAFFERREWMEAWFPGYADEVVALCRQLNARLEPDGPPGAPAQQPGSLQ